MSHQVSPGRSGDPFPSVPGARVAPGHRPDLRPPRATWGVCRHGRTRTAERALHDLGAAYDERFTAEGTACTGPCPLSDDNTRPRALHPAQRGTAYTTTLSA
jgi:hypothetical protein